MLKLKYLAYPVLLVAGLILMVGCSGGREANAKRSIVPEDLAEDIAVLASDNFEGRNPGSQGEQLTLQYIKDEFEELGLLPGNNDSFFQEVPLVTMTPYPSTSLLVWAEGTTNRLIYRQEYVAWTSRTVETVSLNRSELVFCGYGVVAPEYNWNDYNDLDVTGKTVVLLANDPGYVTEDSSLFNGRSNTNYSQWTYKFEEAARQGAEGAIIIHETDPTGFSWEVALDRWTGPQYDLAAEDSNLSRCAVEMWFAEEVARDLFERGGYNFDSLKAQAATPTFQAVPLDQRISVTLTNDISQSTSNNVLALIPGRNRPDEAVIYIAHWDHLGVDPSLEGDQVYNGALNNATGVAGLLELAEAFSSLGSRPARSILFLAVTANEQGLLGSQYYATHPIFPLEKTVAIINIDGLNIFGPMKDVTITGYGNSELDDYVAAAAHSQQREIRPDPDIEKDLFYQSDQISFAKFGVPTLQLAPGIDHIEYGSSWGQAQIDRYMAEHYNTVTDEFDPAWDLSGAVDNLRLLLSVGYRLSGERTFPNWREGNEFRAIRDAQMELIR